jgi:predicted Zn-dependent protease
VGLIDVSPTVLDLVGAPIPPNLDGKSRVPSLRTPARSSGGDVLYAETLYPRLRFGWSDLQSIRNDRFKLIRGREVELYDYRTDPLESTNLAEREPAVVARLDQILTRMTAAHATTTARATPDPDAASRLQALGYVSGSPTLPSTGSLPDPRHETAAYRQLMDARRLLDEGHESEGVRVLETLIGQEPDLEPAHRVLREYWVDRGRLAEAEQWLTRQLAARRANVLLLLDIATIDRAAHHTDRAIQVLDDAIRQSPDNVAVLTLSGEILRDAQRDADALDRFTRAARLAPEDTVARMQVAQTLFAMGRFSDTESTVNGVLTADPHTAGAHYLLAQIAEQRAEGRRAESEYRSEISVSPWDYRARFNLAALLAQRGEHDERLALLESIPKLAPHFYDVYFFLAKALLDTSDRRRFPEAIADAEKGLASAPGSANAPLAHYVLADIYRLQGRRTEAQREQAQGQELERRLGDAHPRPHS